MPENTTFSLRTTQQVRGVGLTSNGRIQERHKKSGTVLFFPEVNGIVLLERKKGRIQAACRAGLTHCDKIPDSEC